MRGLKFPSDANVLVGPDTIDDAGVYKINDELVMIQTVDFFTPIVDDPYWFGQIAAANALSDIYAMGGTPKTAMNLVAFPNKEMDIDILRRIIQGGIDKIREAGAVLLGGHSIADNELKYGLSVTGFAHPDNILTKNNLKPGDRLVLTKPLGTGIINTAIKAGTATAIIIGTVTRQMAALNNKSAEIMAKYPVHACTDITGFGLLGHLAEMVDGSAFGLQLHAQHIPFIPESAEYARMGLVPGGAYKNKEFRQHMIDFSASVDQSLRDILFDPQTSGGLLISVAKASAAGLVAELHRSGIREAALIGEVVAAPRGKIIIT